jgi:hypothetical protein
MLILPHRIEIRGNQLLVLSCTSTAEPFLGDHHSKRQQVHHPQKRNVILELGFNQPVPATILEDSTNAINLADNAVSTSDLKHIDTKYFQTRQFITDGKVIVLYVSTTHQLADILTKQLENIPYSNLSRRLVSFPH